VEEPAPTSLPIIAIVELVAIPAQVVKRVPMGNACVPPVRPTVVASAWILVATPTTAEVVVILAQRELPARKEPVCVPPVRPTVAVPAKTSLPIKTIVELVAIPARLVRPVVGAPAKISLPITTIVELVAMSAVAQHVSMGNVWFHSSYILFSHTPGSTSRRELSFQAYLNKNLVQLCNCISLTNKRNLS
jgi:hypothetical protein